ncbi:MAG: SCP2 sterol-binding domain-containing protein [bacterium]|nr:SCP2 sterol-binding domain-containing protein [bacterium]
MSEIPVDTSIKDLLTSIMPNIAKESLAANSAASELSGTEISMVIDVSGDQYSYIVTNGSDLQLQEGSVNNAMLHLKITKEDLEKMIASQNLDMLLGIQNDLNLAKYNAIKSLRGSIVAELTNDDGSTVSLEAVLNCTADPQATFKMKTSDSSALMRKETNPVNLFMSGAMKIEGDMGFAMATQPLFT